MSDTGADRRATALGIELGSTRIKAVLIGREHDVLATGGHDWENQFVDRLWTYRARGRVGRAPGGLRGARAATSGSPSTRSAISAMMHGYLAFDADGELLVPFRTWRNTNTGAASEQLSERLGQNIPHRWSVAHLYQALLDHEEHVGRVAYVTTLAGYVHWQLTGEKVIGVGDASGMFPIDPATRGYDERMLAQFDELAGPLGLADPAGRPAAAVPAPATPAGALTEDGAARLDPSGTAAAGRPALPAGGRRRDRHGGDQLGRRRAPATSAPGPASSRWSCSTGA